MSELDSAVLASRKTGSSGISDSDILRAIEADALNISEDFFKTDKVRHLLYLLSGQVRTLEARVTKLERGNNGAL